MTEPRTLLLDSSDRLHEGGTPSESAPSESSAQPVCVRGDGDLARDDRRKLLRERFLTWLPLALVLIGVGVLIYPVLATQHNNDEQQRLADMYTATVSAAGPDAVAAQRRSAQAYNNALESAPILDPWLESQRPDTPQYQAYLGELNLDPVMGRVVIPSIHVSLPIFHGTDPHTLASGVGHLFGTSLPVGGPSTHAVLTGHTGLPSATLFDNLTDLKKGDAFYVSSAGQTLKYEVVDISVVTPDETDSLRKVPGRDLVTLITCTPYGINSHRLLVTGERVPMDPTAAAAEEAKALPAPMQTWMKVIIVSVVIILTAVAGILGRLWWRRRSRQAQAAEAVEDSRCVEGIESLGCSVDSGETGAAGSGESGGLQEADDIGGYERWPGHRLKDVANEDHADSTAGALNAVGEPRDDPPGDMQSHES